MEVIELSSTTEATALKYRKLFIHSSQNNKENLDLTLADAITWNSLRFGEENKGWYLIISPKLKEKRFKFSEKGSNGF